MVSLWAGFREVSEAMTGSGQEEKIENRK